MTIAVVKFSDTRKKRVIVPQRSAGPYAQQLREGWPGVVFFPIDIPRGKRGSSANEVAFDSGSFGPVIRAMIKADAAAFYRDALVEILKASQEGAH